MTRTRHSAPSEAPPRGPERLRCPDSYRSMRLEAIDVPRWRSSRWCAVVGRKGVTGVVNAGRPSLSSPSCCQLSDPGRVGDLTRPSLDYEVELGGGDTERASLVASEVPALACRLAGLEPKRAINPKPADAGDGGLPSRLTVANQQVSRSGPPVPGACVTPLLRRASTPLQSRRGDP